MIFRIDFLNGKHIEIICVHKKNEEEYAKELKVAVALEHFFFANLEIVLVIELLKFSVDFGYLIHFDFIFI